MIDGRLARACCLLLAVLLVGGVTACAALKPAQIIEQFNSDATATAVRLALERYHEALRTRNTQQVLQFFVPDTNFRVYDGDDGWLGYDAMRLQDAPAFRRLANVEIQLDALYITPLDPSAAVVADNLRETFTDSAGHSRRVRLTQTMVWTRRADGWKIMHIHSSEQPDTTR